MSQYPLKKAMHAVYYRASKLDSMEVQVVYFWMHWNANLAKVLALSGILIQKGFFWHLFGSKYLPLPFISSCVFHRLSQYMLQLSYENKTFLSKLAGHPPELKINTISCIAFSIVSQLWMIQWSRITVTLKIMPYIDWTVVEKHCRKSP